MNHDRKTVRGILAPSLIAITALATTACSTTGKLEPVEYVDLERFMGDWHVIANIPTFIEKGAHNAIETYSINEDGSIDTVFTFRKGGFEGEKKRYNPRGFVRENTGNAVWGMQFIWPIKADYRIVYLDEDYRVTIIGRNKRDFVWLMARDPSLPANEYDDLVEMIGEMGYDTSELQRVPQQW
ncbi:MAG: lipocalin family protein [Gammaproteobacteria bacterium]|nr:lipocalin family protein [Gammaproteobacteria bacterium]NNF61302.1 lipocalin family protein [Gammaproteobacteria bacterium]NNM20860.1 lipocalin family protein [Gammaproteobacteria bacterium]